MVYVPYWRFRGMVLSLRGHGITGKVVDTSLRAVNADTFPVSLGVRPQALSLKPMEPTTAGEFIAPDVTRKQFQSLLQKRAGLASKKRTEDLFHRAFIGEIVSLIYTPFALKNGKLIDGITGRSLAEQKNQNVKLPQAKSADQLCAPIRFSSTLCPYCGWDLDGHSDTLVLVCSHCDRAWEATARGFQEIEVCTFGDSHNADLWLPFWAIEATCSGFQLQSYADFIRLTNQSRVPLPEMEEQAFRFVVPAYKVNPRLFIHLGSWTTLKQRRPSIIKKIPAKEMHSVNLPPVEGFQSIPIVLGELSRVKDRLLPKIKDGRFAFKGYQLILLPFVHRGLEYIQPDLGFSLPVSALNWGKNI